MKTCKDCLHYEVCAEVMKQQLYIKEVLCGQKNPVCPQFADCSEWVHLPCKVGDTIYCPWVFDGTCGIAVGEVESIKIYADNKSLFIAKDWESDMPMPGAFCLEDFGDIVFLTIEEAKKALKGAENNAD